MFALQRAILVLRVHLPYIEAFLTIANIYLALRSFLQQKSEPHQSIARFEPMTSMQQHREINNGQIPANFEHRQFYCSHIRYLLNTMCLQETAGSERGALAGNLDVLMGVARAHAQGKEAYARKVTTSLLEEFLRVEEAFQPGEDGLTEQETIDAMRQVRITQG